MLRFSLFSQTLSPPPHRRPTRRAHTLLELMISISLSLLAMIALLSTVIMTNQFLKEGFWENRLRARTSSFLEKCKFALTFAYQRDTPKWDPSRETTYMPLVNENKDEIYFWTPDGEGDSTAVDAYLLRKEPGTNKVVLTKNGVELDAIDHVTEFKIENQAGLLTLVVTANYSFYGTGGRRVRKQFTLVSRSLPRNHGEMTLD